MYLGLQSVSDAALLAVMRFIDPRAARARLLLALSVARQKTQDSYTNE